MVPAELTVYSDTSIFALDAPAVQKSITHVPALIVFELEKLGEKRYVEEPLFKVKELLVDEGVRAVLVEGVELLDPLAVSK